MTGNEKVKAHSPFTWVVASQACGAAEHLPEKGRVVLSVLFKHFLQGLCPVQLIQHNGGWRFTEKHTRHTQTQLLKVSVFLPLREEKKKRKKTGSGFDKHKKTQYITAIRTHIFYYVADDAALRPCVHVRLCM